MPSIRCYGFGVAFAALIATGCANQPSARVCQNGIVCPDGTTCAAVQAICIVGNCGNGLTDSGETCDDGNVIDGDGCSHSCKDEQCGNGDMDPGEKCDDGNNRDGDGCSADCKSVEVCGNGIKDVNEACDDGEDADGNTKSGDGCSADCKSTEVCGNGIKDINELCDDGHVPGGCNDDCQGGTGCGDGTIDKDAMGRPTEECDDGNLNDQDDCHGCHLNVCGDHVVQTSGVRREDCDPGTLGVALQTADCNIDCTQARCGDTKVNPLNTTLPATAIGEQCDDGDATEGNSCDSNCTIPACGNKIVDPGEDCDDGDATEGNGCDTNCKSTGCGNGIKTAGEACDDGNDDDNDGCSKMCVVEVCGDGTPNNREACDTAGDSQTCNADCTAAACGDGKINPSFKPAGAPRTEECDDHNTMDGDGCSSKCQFEFCGDGVPNNGEICDTGGNSQLCNADCTTPSCGDHKINPSFKPDGTNAEQCDDGGTTPNDGCSPTCQFERCGNGVIDPGEQCDGAPVGVFACFKCHLVKCGDGIRDAGEQCDDGNNSRNDDCISDNPDPATCKIATCGDGIRNTAREDCDNGATNGDLNDLCSDTCHTVHCGNGFLEQGEACDDGDEVDTNGCTAACNFAACGDGITEIGVEDCDNGVDNGAPGNICSTDCHAQACGNGVIDPSELCDDRNTSTCGACSDTCQVVTPAEAATGLIISGSGTDFTLADTFTINDGLGANVTFTFVASNPTGTQIGLDPALSNVGMATLLAGAITNSGLQIDAVQLPATAVITLIHRVKTSKGTQPMVNGVTHGPRATNFAMSGMVGGHSGDCPTSPATGCTTDSDCLSNNCVAGVCKACTSRADCETTNRCDVVAGACRECRVNLDCGATGTCRPDHTCL